MSSSTNPRTVVHVWRVTPAAVPAALLRMAVDRANLRGTPGLRFHRLLGTGNGRSFEVGDADPLTWALLTVWDDEAASLTFETHPTTRGWRRIAVEEWRADLACLRVRGEWVGQQPFPVDHDLPRPWEGPVASITRASIRPTRWRSFWRSVPPVVADLDLADGPTVRFGIGEAPVGVQGTLTVWPHVDALVDFAHRRSPHRAVVDRTPAEGWYAEELFGRFAVLAERGTLFGERRDHTWRPDPAGAVTADA